MTINLPNLKDYQQEFLLQGVNLPLKTVPFSNKGLLRELPAPPNGKTGWPWTLESKPLPTKMPNGLMYPKISIVTPSYNQGEFIEETIRSVLLQNYPNLEFIICDGNSNDNTKEILQKYSPWLSFWQSKKDRGQGHAINLGFSLSSGDYYAWINSDDYYLPNCFQKIFDTFVNTNKDFLYGDSLILNEDHKTIRYYHNYIVLDRYLRFGGIIGQHSSFWKSSIHEPIWEELNCAIDAELWLRLVPGRTRTHLKAPLAVIRVQPESKTVNEKYQKMWQQDYEEKIWKNYDSIPDWKYRTYEFRLIQSFYRKTLKLSSKEAVESLISRDDLTVI